MGWLYYAPSKDELIEDLLSDCQSTSIKRRALAHEVTREGEYWVLWSVAEITAIDDSNPYLAKGKTLKLICCDLLGCHGNSWGVKRLDETASPYYYSCPVYFLDLADEFMPEWREQVRTRISGDQRQQR